MLPFNLPHLAVDIGRHQVALDLLGPTGRRAIPTVRATFWFQPDELAALAAELLEFHWTASFSPLTIAASGTYRFVLEVDDETIAERTFVVAEPPPVLPLEGPPADDWESGYGGGSVPSM